MGRSFGFRRSISGSRLRHAGCPRRRGSCMSCCSSAVIGGVQAHRGVELGVVAGRVGAELDQVARLVVARVQLAEAPRRVEVLARRRTLVITREIDFSTSMAG